MLCKADGFQILVFNIIEPGHLVKDHFNIFDRKWEVIFLACNLDYFIIHLENLKNHLLIYEKSFSL